MSLAPEDRPPAGPDDALRTIQESQGRAVRRLWGDARLLYWPWGVALLVGFGLSFLRHGPDGRVFLPMPEWVPQVVLFGLLGAAWVVLLWGDARSTRQVQGPSTLGFRRWLLAVAAGVAAVIAVLSQVAGQLPADQAAVLWPGVILGVSFALLAAAGAQIGNRVLFTLGMTLTGANVAGVFAGPGWYDLILALAGGGGYLLAGAVDHRQSRRWVEASG